MPGFINKVVVNDEVKIDLTADTVDADHLISGYTAHNNSGAPITGVIEERSSADVKIDSANKSIIIPSGYYPKGIQIELKDWVWDPFDFETGIITNASDIKSIKDM